MNVYERLTQLYGNTWSISNNKLVTCEAEGRLVMTVDLTVKDRTLIGCASMDIDYSRDISEKLLQNAVLSACKKLKYAGI